MNYEIDFLFPFSWYAFYRCILNTLCWFLCVYFYAFMKLPIFRKFRTFSLPQATARHTFFLCCFPSTNLLAVDALTRVSKAVEVKNLVSQGLAREGGFFRFSSNWFHLKVRNSSVHWFYALKYNICDKMKSIIASCLSFKPWNPEQKHCVSRHTCSALKVLTTKYRLWIILILIEQYNWNMMN